MLGLKKLIIFVLAATVPWAVPVVRAGADAADLNKVLKGIEQRYAGKVFKASFFQESMLKAMNITDTAEGYLIVKPPGKMRWEYTIPDAQSIITDGRSMWIYRPADRQVMVGKSPAFFGEGKGAGFLSDIGQIRKSFNVQLLPAQNEQYHRLKLIPLKAGPELTDLILSVSWNTFRIDQVVTHNAYGDETRIILSDYQFGIQAEDALFTFTIPEGVDVVQMEQF
ncbi:MAG: outer membrane lipoprotein carrier protein LolA [Desulfobacteraceae bacterium]|nr:MAG: outer membrane lipoprotein carrier protein LolA [Desulfobacteraceae bacterium]